MVAHEREVEADLSVAQWVLAVHICEAVLRSQVLGGNMKSAKLLNLDQSILVFDWSTSNKLVQK